VFWGKKYLFLPPSISVNSVNITIFRPWISILKLKKKTLLYPHMQTTKYSSILHLTQSFLILLPQENKYIPNNEITIQWHLTSFVSIVEWTKWLGKRFVYCWTLNRLVPTEVHYMEKNAGMFSSKTFISFWLKKEWHGHLGWHGGE